MNKIAVYLNEHLLGEVSSSKAIRRRYSRDGSVLSITPEIVVFPRVTNDVRKAARFAWQLAEKGHALAMTVRGLGGDTTGAAIGKGMVLSISTHLNKIIHLAVKDRLVHVQPGVTFAALDTMLKWHGLAIPNMPVHARHTTVGGAIASNSLGNTGEVGSSIEKLEVVLANGDLIETGRMSRHDLSKKLGLQTFEGEIYRKLEGIIEDNEELLKQIAADPVRDNAGYRSIAAVKNRDGSFDLTPLFIGSQGTLGIISEIVLKAEFYSQDQTMAVAIAESNELARDITDRLKELEPAQLDIYDGELFRRASEQGAQFSLLGSTDQIGSVIYVRFNDFSDRAQAGKLKKMRKLLMKLNVGMVDSTDHAPEEFDAITGVTDSLGLTANDNDVALPLLDGSFIPAPRREEFANAIVELATKHHMQLPLKENPLTGTVYAYPILKLDVVSDKQKLFRLLTDYAALVDKLDGAFVSDGAEGRLKSNAAWSVMDEAHAHLYEQVRAVFDPFGTLNPGVKQKNDIRGLASALRSSYDVGDFVS
ncbi:MAG: FAD-binding oxidoreductase [Candidatus Microsaccharimonas sp.]